ncbi:MAG TPA: tetratricopeptide repeat protein [Sandaracinaceae bacterium LLY-WYZ-13_1]|nr:tetratricopeptide repeat protein [Sandaracinaceae bacterium LLY-WYZ-13_1]
MRRPLASGLALAVLALAAGTRAQAPRRDRARPSARAARLLQTGQAYLRAGDRGSAIGYFREAIQAAPRSPEPYAALGDAYRARGSLDDARAVYETGLARNPDHAPLWLGLARTLVDAGDADAAAAAVRSLLARAPHHAEGLRLRADLARRRGAWSEALTAYRTLLASADEAGLSEAERAEARRYEAALRLLARPLDPVSAPRACGGSAVRRALAGCR